MVLTRHQRIFIVLCLLVLSGWALKLLASEPKTPASSDSSVTVTTTEEWRTRMRKMLDSSLDLFPYALNDVEFKNPKNQEAIKKLITSLAEGASGLEEHARRGQSSTGPSVDPVLSFSAGVLKEELEIAKSVLEAGHPEQAQAFVTRSLSQCLGCHTQTSAGTQYVQNMFNKRLDKLDSRSRFFALAATRQFDPALNAFKEAIAFAPSSGETNELSSLNHFAIERISRIALALGVRVKQDPKLTLQVVETLANAPGLYPYFKKTVEAWRASANLWVLENSAETSKDRPSTDQEMFESARKLISRAQQNRSKGNGAGDVDFLRATSLMHELLRKYPDSSLQARTYMELATVYDTLQGFAFWDLSDQYLEACIRKTPHSDLALKCYSRYKDSLFLGYTGSSGTHIPSSVRKHLEKMENLATPETLRIESKRAKEQGE